MWSQIIKIQLILFFNAVKFMSGAPGIIFASRSEMPGKPSFFWMVNLWDGSEKRINLCHCGSRAKALLKDINRHFFMFAPGQSTQTKTTSAPIAPAAACLQKSSCSGATPITKKNKSLFFHPPGDFALASVLKPVRFKSCNAIVVGRHTPDCKWFQQQRLVARQH